MNYSRRMIGLLRVNRIFIGHFWHWARPNPTQPRRGILWHNPTRPDPTLPDPWMDQTHIEFCHSWSPCLVCMRWIVARHWSTTATNCQSQLTGEAITAEMTYLWSRPASVPHQEDRIAPSPTTASEATPPRWRRIPTSAAIFGRVMTSLRLQTGRREDAHARCAVP